MNRLFPYVAETRGIAVRVSVSFMAEQSDPDRGRWFWAYHIRIENHGDMAVQLLSRRWLIRDARAAENHVEGDGVIGEQPVIRPGQAYDYVSGCPLATPSGSMVGSYEMMGEDGSRFDVAIPQFSLAAPVTAG
ncbi:MAG TPA: Co2+/Mg2+ efflux protein ApaG [Chakrabartia sp.]|nr:Co2+/Mg2+ efflux protein ApaG [Chakrabartia sp.]